jgi:hypothetical protein
MPSYAQLQQRWETLAEQIKSLGPMRSGSICRQTVYSVNKDGSRKPQGPYLIYTHKAKGKTVTRRLSDPTQVETYRRQIANFRRFEQLTSELAQVGRQRAQQEGDAAVGDQKKTFRR